MSLLDEYLASIKYLPGEVTRSLELIGALDSKVKKLTEELERMKTAFLRHRGDSELLSRIEAGQTEIGNLTDEKITIAKQLSEAVIKHKQRLEADLTKLDRTLRAGNDQEEQHKRRKQERSKRQLGLEDYNPYLYVSELAQDDLGGPDIEVKKYCICNQESFGNMVECDNKHVSSIQCEREWFHYECVGLTAPPRGAWFCPQCSS
jgi:hypothetical protein